MKISVNSLLVAVAISSASISFPAMSAYEVFAHGTQLCSKWNSEEAKDSWIYRTNEAWVLGFVSGAGFGEDSEYDTSYTTMLEWVERYCEANPQKAISDATESLIYELRK
jgi:hypothetical protein